MYEVKSLIDLFRFDSNNTNILILLIRLRLRVLDDGLAIAAVKAEFDTWRTYGHVQDNPALHELDCNPDY